MCRPLSHDPAALIGSQMPRASRRSINRSLSAFRKSISLRTILLTATSTCSTETKTSGNMPEYTNILLQDSIKAQTPRCKLQRLESKCLRTVEKLRAALEEHLQNGVPTAEMLEKTVSLLTLKKALLFPNGYSRCSRDILRLFPSPDDDITPLLCQN
ncbi:hypothetical protein AALO_G00137500 [Alosa alosa]|uniref:Uncharacterized protein n=1 Tax=Alosa alosa TaxID=278164 RepID=A0AAV6GKL9_9TELE|nr:hypothetical protein AALO_G00137500 [Alosa alosa]